MKIFYYSKVKNERSHTLLLSHNYAYKNHWHYIRMNHKPEPDTSSLGGANCLLNTVSRQNLKET